MSNSVENSRFMTREQLSKELGISLRKLYDDIQKSNELKELIPKRGLLNPLHVRAIQDYYNLNN
jgi:hypothetical protein